MADNNKAMIRRALDEVYNQGNFGVAAEWLDNDFTIHAPTQEIRGRDNALGFVAMLRGGIPDLHLTIVEQIAEGDRVATRWVARGTHLGEVMGMAPTGRSLTVSGTDIDRIANGKVVECWTTFDDSVLMQQLAQALEG